MARDSALTYSSKDEIPTQPGSIVADRYRVDRILGSGPMSVVVAATHLDIDRPVAIKFLNPEGASSHDAAERFRREAQTAARIRNEHVVRVIDVGALPNGIPLMVMDLVEGRNFREELNARGPLSVTEAAGYVLQAIEALAEAHAFGVVHRDLKPANLFLAERPDRTRVVKVLDFGVSKSLGDSSGEPRLGLTRTGMVIGSPLYMPPEQLQSPKSVDCRADIWALGVVLFELVTGRVPYDTTSLPELCTMLLTEPPASVTRYRSDVPREFEAVIVRCLARERSDRYQNVAELAAALLPFTSAELHVHAERAQRTLDRSSQVASSGVKVAFVASRSSRLSAPMAAPSRLRDPRTWIAVSLALGALIGVCVANTDAGRAAPSLSPLPTAVAVHAAAPATPNEPSLAPSSSPVVAVGAPVAQAEKVPESPPPGTTGSPVEARAMPRPLASLTPPRPLAVMRAPSAAPAASGLGLTDFGGRK